MMTNLWVFQDKIRQLKETLEYVQIHSNNIDPLIIRAELHYIYSALENIYNDERSRRHIAAISFKRIYLLAHNALYRKLCSEKLIGEELEIFFKNEISEIERVGIKI